MRRILPTRFTLPLYLAAGATLGFTVLVAPSLSQNTRLSAYLLCIFILGILLFIRIRLSPIESIIRNTKVLPKNSENLTVSEQLNVILEETSGSTRREISTALADTQAEINALQSQINPHFLYNTLDSIRGQALIDNSPVIADMTEALSVLFRYSISRSGNLVTLQEEFRCIEKYLMIQQFRFSGKFTFRKDIDEDLLSCHIPRLTLQPIIENAIFHGLETQTKGGIIILALEQCGSYLIVRVSDNGIGISESQLLAINERLRVSSLSASPAQSKRGSGIALSNINRRIRLAFGEAYGISVFSTPGLGTDVEIALPIYQADPVQEGAHGN